MNKCDLTTDLEETEHLLEAYRALNLPVFLVSATERIGIDALETRLRDETVSIVAFAGRVRSWKKFFIKHLHFREPR